MHHRSIYCSYSIFQRIIRSQEKNSEEKSSEEIILQEQYAPFYNLIKGHDHIVFDISEEELNDAEADLALFRSNSSITTDTVPNFLDNLPFQIRKGSGNAVFLLEAYQQDYAETLSNYGVCVIFLERPDSIKILQSNLYWQLESHAFMKQSGSQHEVTSWGSLLKKGGLIPLPINALVLVDNYMLQFDKPEDVRKAANANILDVLIALMPSRQNPEFPFQILLATTSKADLWSLSPERSRVQRMLDETKKVLLNTLAGKKNYEIELDIILLAEKENKFLHRRAIVSNYHFLRFDRGFNTFKGNRIQAHNDISIDGAFKNLGQKSHMPWQSMALELRSIKAILSKNDFVVTTGPCKNRLLEMVS